MKYFTKLADKMENRMETIAHTIAVVVWTIIVLFTLPCIGWCLVEKKSLWWLPLCIFMDFIKWFAMFQVVYGRGYDMWINQCI